METIIETDHSKLLKYPEFIPKEDLKKLKKKCLKLPLNIRPEIKIFGKICRQQRNVGFFAKPGISGYKYSGQQTNVINIEEYPFLVKILNLVNEKLETEYNGILVNLYENGSNYIGAHSDDENGIAPIGVASISFGATRTFRIRTKYTKKIVKDIQHVSGDLLLMTGNFQKEFTHEIPIQRKIEKPRVSLTFRMHH